MEWGKIKFVGSLTVSNMKLVKSGKENLNRSQEQGKGSLGERQDWKHEGQSSVELLISQKVESFGAQEWETAVAASGHLRIAMLEGRGLLQM